ncbi:MAG TPA: hypothetical protein DCX95_02270 [Elusimicrobia bacterium]|nr:hypothetical protein [Elusimicrobiota bacterium]
MNYTIECEVFGALQKKIKKNKFTLKIKEGTTYEQLLTKSLKFSPEHSRHLTIISNSKSVGDFSEKIPNKANIKVLMAIGGG